MAVYKRFNSKRITSRHPAYSKARWWVYKRIKGQKPIHQVIPEARTREEAELAERHLVRALFDRAYGIADNTTTFEDFVESTYRKYVEAQVAEGILNFKQPLTDGHAGLNVVRILEASTVSMRDRGRMIEL